MASLWRHQDYSANTAPEHPASTSLVGVQRPLTPLILHRDWLEPSTYYSSANFGDDDFQSNHLDLTSARPPSDFYSLSGLGIRNLDLDMDSSLIDNASDMIGIFNGARMLPNHGVRKVDFEIFSPDRCDNEIDANFDVARHNSTGRTLLCGSSWSASVLNGSELGTNDSLTDLDSNISAEASHLVTHTSNETDPGDIPLFFEELSAATGLSMSDFAAHISATAEVALMNMAAVETPAVSNEGIAYDAFQFQTNANDLGPRWFAADLVLPFESSVFRDVPASWCAGVNPADILPAQQPIEMSPPAQLLGPVFDPLPVNDFVDIPRNGGFQPPPLTLQKDANPERFSFLDPAPRKETRRLSDDEHSLFQSPSSSEYSPSLPVCGQKKTLRLRTNRRTITRNTPQSDLPVPQSPEMPDHYDESTLLPINLGTPVFDAHRGIEIEVLKEKGERYRLRNQGRDYDKRWLISFAGKLSPKGEHMDEFRCYIKGCKQTNKRRDHILIHVGAHLDQRPFKCIHWYVNKFIHLYKD